MRKELVQLSIALSIVAVALLGCGTETIPAPTAIPIVAVLGEDDPVVQAYGDLYQRPVYEMTESTRLTVINLSQIMTVYPGIVQEIMDYFQELAKREQLKGRQTFVSINGQTLTYTVSPSKENAGITVVVLPDNIIPLQAVKKSSNKYPNAFTLKQNGGLFLFVNGESEGDQDDYAKIDTKLFPEPSDRVNRSFYEELCNFRVTVAAPIRTPPGEIKKAFCFVNSHALLAAQQNAPYQRFNEWAASLDVRKLTGVQNSLVPTREEYSRIARIFGNAIVQR